MREGEREKERERERESERDRQTEKVKSLKTQAERVSFAISVVIRFEGASGRCQASKPSGKYPTALIENLRFAYEPLKETQIVLVISGIRFSLFVKRGSASSAPLRGSRARV